MNDANAKARTFTRTTLTPTAAAERSLARTASMADPRALRRSAATPTATTTSVNRHNRPNPMRGKSLPAPMPRSMPSIDGGVTRAPELLTMSALRTHTASMAYASASVTTPSVRPRSRRAGRPTTTPTPVATSAASSGANGNGTPQPSVRPLRVNAAAPANASWASDTWPA